MKKIKILYFVSSLKKCGPTNQLYYIIRNLDFSVFEPSILVLAPFSESWRTEDFRSLGVTVQTLSLSKFGLLFCGFFRVRSYLKSADFDIIHSSGFLPDFFMSLGYSSDRWVTTLRNFPREDYPDRYGHLVGRLMAHLHAKAIRSCRHAIACSKSLASQFLDAGISCDYIRNGVYVDQARGGGSLIPFPRIGPVFVVVSELVGRKNIDLVIKAFNLWSQHQAGVLLIVGDGPEMHRLREMAGKNVFFSGKVENIFDYLRASDVHVSSSSSEGLPNSVLEAAAVGKINLLSDIGPHVEIFETLPQRTLLFSLQNGVSSLLKGMQASVALAKGDVLPGESEEMPFSASSTSQRYQILYKSLMGLKT